MISYQEFSQSLRDIRMSPIVSISELVRERAAGFRSMTGEDFVYFQRGEIGFDTPAYISQAAERALAQGFTRYPKSGGEDVYKDAVIAKMARVNNAHGLGRENVLATYGGQEGLQLAFKLFEGRKGAGFAPCWSCVLENFVPYCQINFTEVALNPDFSVDYDALEDTLRGVDFFYLNTPQNPTGKVFTEQEVRRIVALCELHGVWLISDEAYERTVYDGLDHFSPSAVESDRIISCFTLSKAYAMTGWRLGYVVCRDPKVIQILRLGDYSQTAGVVTFLQHAAAEAMNNVEAEKVHLDAMNGEMQARRDLLYTELNAIPGLQVSKPQGAFYFFPNFSNLIPPHLEGVERQKYIFNILLDAGVAVVYGACFGKHFGDNVRLSFSAASLDEIRLGATRIREALERAASPALV